VWYAPMADAPADAVTYGSSEAGRIPFSFSVNRPPHYWPRCFSFPSHLARSFVMSRPYAPFQLVSNHTETSPILQLVWRCARSPGSYV
jgi:hypothetical protein